MMLTKNDIKAMREAGRVVLRSVFPDNTGIIECSKADGPWTQHYTIDVDGVSVACPKGTQPREAVAVVHTAQFVPAWRTVCQIARPGDHIRLAWYHDKLNRYTYFDEVAVEIHRPLKKRVKVFHISVEVGSQMFVEKGGKAMRREIESNQQIITIRRPHRAKTYANISYPSVLRITRIVNKMVRGGKCMIHLSPGYWIVTEA